MSKPVAPASAPAPAAAPEPTQPDSIDVPSQELILNGGQDNSTASWQEQAGGTESYGNEPGFNVASGAEGNQSHNTASAEDDNYGPINVKEDG